MTTEKQRQTVQMALPATLACRMKEAGLQLTRESFTDLVYILQEVHRMPLGYRFTLYVYGPQCMELAQELNISKLRGMVNALYDQEANSTRITPGSKTNRIKEDQGVLAEYEGQIQDTVKTFGHLGPGELNLRSSIIHVCKNLSDLPENESDRTDQVTKMMWALKPHQDEARVRRAIRELREMKAIR